MKLYNLSLISFSLLILGCYKDTSELGGKPISEITIKTEINRKIFEVERGDTFVLKPEIEQRFAEKPLQYEWEIDGKIVSTDKDLNFLVDIELGEFNGRYTVKNEDGATFADFQFNVNSRYQIGLLAMGKNDSGTTLAFKRLDKDTGGFTENVFTLNNPSISLGKEPLSIYQFDNAGNPQNRFKFVDIATKDPAVFLRMNSKTFEVSNIYEYPKGIAEGFASYTVGSSSSSLYVLGGGYLYLFVNNFFLDLYGSKIPADAYLSKYAVGVNSRNIAFFDDSKGRFFITRFDTTTFQTVVVNVMDGTFNGKELVNMLTIDGGSNVLAILKDKANNAPYVVKYNVASNILEKNYDATGTTLDIDGAFLSDKFSATLYYSSGNKVFAYNHLTNNFPTTPVIEVDAGTTIKSMVFSPDNQKLFIATNTSNNTYHVYSYIINFTTNTYALEWKEENINGSIKEMIYKQ